MNSTAYITINLTAFLAGQWLVTRNHWSGFLVWCAANAYSIATCMVTDMPQTSCLFAAYLVVNFASLRSWYAKSRATSLRPTTQTMEPASEGTLTAAEA